MQPGEYNLKVYRGDYYYGPVIPLFSLAPWGGPSNPTSHDMKAEVKPRKNSSTVIAEFTVEIVNSGDMTVRLTMEPEDTELITKNCVWDFQVSTSESRKWTLFAGKVTQMGQVTE